MRLAVSNIAWSPEEDTAAYEMLRGVVVEYLEIAPKQGSRFIPGGHHEHTPLSRLLAVRLLHAPLISLAAGFRYTDTTNGFRAYSRRFLEDPRVSPFRDVFGAYELHYYLAIRAAKLGFRTCELPVSRVYPATGKAPTKISPFRGNLLVLKTLINACLGKYDPNEQAR